jgi:hypothetical protein
MTLDDEVVVFFSSKRRTTSSRRPGAVQDRPVLVRVLRVVPCACGGLRQETALPHQHDVRVKGGRYTNCLGQPVERDAEGRWQRV